MALGIRQFYTRTAPLVITNSIVLQTAGVAVPVAASQTISGQIIVPFNLGATGGARFQLVTPAAVTAFACSFFLQQTSSAVNVITQAASAVITNALAAAAEYSLLVVFQVVNGVNAGSIDLQCAQTTADPLSMTVRQGTWADVVIL